MGVDRHVLSHSTADESRKERKGTFLWGGRVGRVGSVDQEEGVGDDVKVDLLASDARMCEHHLGATAIAVARGPRLGIWRAAMDMRPLLVGQRVVSGQGTTGRGEHAAAPERKWQEAISKSHRHFGQP